MAIEFTKEEIKEFLAEQGYDVSDEDTLKKFIHDLKKLIKHEEMKKRRRRLGHHPDETVLDSTEDSVRPNETSGETSTSSGPYPHDHVHSYRSSRGISHRSPDGSSRRKSPEKGGRSGRPKTPSPAKEHPADLRQSQTFEELDDVDARRQTSASKISTANKENSRTGRTGGRMIMNRVTATTDENGEAVVHRSEVDLGSIKRSARGHAGGGPGLRARPQTAPARHFRKPEPRHKEPPTRKTSQPFSSKERLERASRLTKNTSRDGAQGCRSMEPDELFYVLREIMFPDDQSDSQDSLYSGEKSN